MNGRETISLARALTGGGAIARSLSRDARVALAKPQLMNSDA